jgi:hypothetical protein
MFHHDTLINRHRMRFFRDSMNGNYDNMHPDDFPHIFATCRGLDPQPSFQILRVERMRGYDEQAVYRLIEEQPQVHREWNIFHDGNPEDSLMGQMQIYRPGNNPNELTSRVRFHIRNIYLISRNETFPVVMFDNFDVLPRATAVILPTNAHLTTRDNYNYPRGDPNFTSHYLMDQSNFMNPNMNLTNRVIDIIDRMRSRRFNIDNDRGWYGGIPDRYENDIRRYYDDDDRRWRDRSPEYDYDFHHPIAAGAGVRSRRHRGQTPPQTPPRRPSAHPVNVVWGGEPMPAAAAPNPAPARPISLQAFTIQALINHAIAEQMTCPISMNPIVKDTACVTTCQHIFERDSIQQWLTGHTNCPVCRQTTSICS